MDWKASVDGTFSDALTGRNVFRLALCWLAGLTALVAYGTMSAKPSVPIRSLLAEAPRHRANETGPLAAGWHEAGEEPVACTVRFDNLTVEATGSGPEKAVLIEDLHLRFEQPAVRGEKTSSASYLPEFCALFSLGGREGTPSLGLFDRVTGGQGDWSAPVDLTGAIEVRVRNLHWQVCRGDETILRVECGQARFPRDPRDCVLDSATVNTGEAVLKSERLALDLANKRFVTRRALPLARPGQSHAGLWGAFTPDLRLIELGLQPRPISQQVNALMVFLVQFGVDPLDTAAAWLHKYQAAMTERFCSGFVCTDPRGQFTRLVDRDWAPLLEFSGRLLRFALSTKPESTAQPNKRPIKSAQATAL
jgi:hypothetical protein